MRLRTRRERAIQAISYELGGLLLLVPLYAVLADEGGAESAMLLAVLAVAVLVWSPIHNTLFDWADARLSGRLASDRSHRWRAVHAVTHEVSSIVVTLPIIMGLTGLGLGGALALDLGLTAFYAAYAYVFHLAFDRVRPMRPSPGADGEPCPAAAPALSPSLRQT